MNNADLVIENGKLKNELDRLNDELAELKSNKFDTFKFIFCLLLSGCLSASCIYLVFF